MLGLADHGESLWSRQPLRADPVHAVTIQPGDLCQVCKERAALVTIGGVDYCAGCAPNWREEVDGDDDEEEEAAA